MTFLDGVHIFLDAQCIDCRSLMIKFQQKQGQITDAGQFLKIETLADLTRQCSHLPLGDMMHSRKPHPARRLGEKNFDDPGYNWGRSSHMFPGRRRGERNYFSWKKQMSGRQGFPSCDEETCDDRCDNEPDHRQGSPGLSVSKSLAATHDMMKSLSELVRVLEGIRSVANQNDLTKANDRLLQTRFQKCDKVDDIDGEERTVLAVIDQLKVLGGSQRIPFLNRNSEAQFYGHMVMPANDAVPAISLPEK